MRGYELGGLGTGTHLLPARGVSRYTTRKGWKMGFVHVNEKRVTEKNVNAYKCGSTYLNVKRWNGVI